LLPAMMLSTAEWAAEILAARVAGMSEKPNPAMATVRDTAAQMKMFRQDRVQSHLILLNKWFSAIVLMPIHPKSENFRDGYGKSDRFSVMILNASFTTSSYPIDAKASRGRARSFYAFSLNYDLPIRISHPSTMKRPSLLPCRELKQQHTCP
jgi:hypothetical protein